VALSRSGVRSPSAPLFGHQPLGRQRSQVQTICGRGRVRHFAATNDQSRSTRRISGICMFSRPLCASTCPRRASTRQRPTTIPPPHVIPALRNRMRSRAASASSASGRRTSRSGLAEASAARLSHEPRRCMPSSTPATVSHEIDANRTSDSDWTRRGSTAHHGTTRIAR
jgi:hypothetical protein